MAALTAPAGKVRTVASGQENEFARIVPMALLGAVGVAAGLSLGVAMSQVLIQVVNPQSFHWTMETRLPWPLFASLAAALVAASAGTAVLAGRSALSAGAIRAVREDW